MVAATGTQRRAWPVAKNFMFLDITVFRRFVELVTGYAPSGRATATRPSYGDGARRTGVAVAWVFARMRTLGMRLGAG